MADKRVINFGAGPSALPLSVLEEASHGLIDFNHTGIGIAEISHRSKEFKTFLEDLESKIRTQLEVPSTHKIIFTQGGGTGQFSAVVYNLLARHWLLYPEATPEERRLDYIITGGWSKKAYEEAQRLCTGPRGVGGTPGVIVDSRQYSEDGKKFDNIPHHAEYNFGTLHSGIPPAMIYYCENETVDGVQFNDDPGSANAFPFNLMFPPAAEGEQQRLLPLVGDHSSSFMSRPIPRLADHAIIYAGAQKNLGPAGLTVVIVRQDCIVNPDAAAVLGAAPVPVTMSYKHGADNGSLYHTPSVFSVYVSGLVMDRMQELGGLAAITAENKRKQEKVYAAVKEGEDVGVYIAKVQEGSRSWMNVVFGVLGEGAEKRFLEGAEAAGMKALAGHRFVQLHHFSLWLTYVCLALLAASVPRYITRLQKSKLICLSPICGSLFRRKLP